MNAGNKLLNCDVLAGLATIEDESVDLVIADPPYGIDKNFGQPDSWKNIEDWKGWCHQWLSECKRVLKCTGSILVYGIHHYVCYNQIQLYQLGFRYRRQIIWHYENGFCGNKWLRATYEPILWFSKGESFYFEQIREPYKSTERLKYEIRKNGKVWRPNPEGRIAGDVWKFPTLAGRRFREEKVDHPTQKPLNLSERLVNHFAPPGGMTLIPFAGSGSECIAAHRLSRHFIAIEINSYYCSIILDRLAEDGWKPALSHPVWLEGENIAVYG